MLRARAASSSAMSTRPFEVAFTAAFWASHMTSPGANERSSRGRSDARARGASRGSGQVEDLVERITFHVDEHATAGELDRLELHREEQLGRAQRLAALEAHDGAVLHEPGVAAEPLRDLDVELGQL